MNKIVKNIQETKKKINSLEFDAHWYRRVFHAFGASFLFYYMLPDVDWINAMKYWVPPIVVVLAISLEVLRLKGKISSDHFFGLRMYEKNRVGSYLFFAVGVLILLRFFPKQIAIPCILCACLADPIMGEVRHRLGKKQVYLIGFLLCMLFFIITWYKADIRLMSLVAVVGAFGAVIGETKKFWWLDDDFMIQMVPAILVLIVWLIAEYYGYSLPGPVIYPGVMPW